MLQNSPIQIGVSDATETEFVDFLQGRLRAFNNERSPAHRAVRAPRASRPLHVMLRDADGAVVGGLTASTYWTWLDIDTLFVPERARGAGTGSQLLRAAETEAVARGARHALLTTFDFQARGFYERHGYRVTGVLDDYPPGHSYYWMRKELNGSLQSPHDAPAASA